MSQDALPTELPRPGQKKQQQPGHDSRVGNEHGGVRQTNIFPPAPSFKTFRKFSPCRPFSRTSIVGFVGLEFDGNKISMEKHSKEFLSLSLSSDFCREEKKILAFVPTIKRMKREKILKRCRWRQELFEATFEVLN